MSEPDDKLRQFVKEHQVRWNARPLVAISQNDRVPVGFELEVAASHGKVTQPPAPGCRQCEQLFSSLKQLVENILPKERRPSRWEILPFDHSFHMDRRNKWKPEVVLTLQILHRGNYFQPVDSCEEVCLKEMKEALKELGARQAK